MPAILATLLGCPGITLSADPSASFRPVASIQEIMQAIVDTSADGIWNSVETVQTASGTVEHAPRTPGEWAQTRLAAITLIEATNLLVIGGRRVGTREFPAEADGALDSAHIQKLIRQKRAAFDAFALALRQSGLTILAAIDAQDPGALVRAGGALDAVCESCHLSFWYPNQVIPPYPKPDDTARPIFRAGSPPR